MLSRRRFRWWRRRARRRSSFPCPRPQWPRRRSSGDRGGRRARRGPPVRPQASPEAWTPMASSISRRAPPAIIVRPLAVRALIVWTLAAAALASGGPARAEAPPANEAARSAARAKLVEGVDALGRGEHRLALDKFEQAYALVPSPKIHY